MFTYRLFFINFGYSSQAEYDSITAALEAARKCGFEVRIDRVCCSKAAAKPIVIWSPSLGKATLVEGE